MLRKEVLIRDNYSCRFCQHRALTYQVVDHINGNAADNSKDNLGVNCPSCDAVRHCGLAGMHRTLLLYHSDLPQVEIVKKTRSMAQKKQAIPHPSEVDPKAIEVKGISMVAFANILLVKDYSELSAEQLGYRGFFSSVASLKRICNS